ncbi:hypothetical protein J4429_01300 [Candidatus Pacearchaeota archaeon]|nr:hypothetical protein [Candidatus Pacearchaeota archaeon]
MVKAKILRDLMTQRPIDYVLPARIGQKIGRSENCQIRILEDSLKINYGKKILYYANAVSKNAGTIIQGADRSVMLHREIGIRMPKREIRESSKIYIIPPEDVDSVKLRLASLDQAVEDLLEKIDKNEDTGESEKEINGIRRTFLDYLLYPDQTEYVADGSLVIFGINYKFMLLQGDSADINARASSEKRLRSRDTQIIKPSDTSLKI